MSRRGHAWRKGAEGALYLGNGLTGQTLCTHGTADAPCVAVYRGELLLAAKMGRVMAGGEVHVLWGERWLPAQQAKNPRAPHARYRADVPTEETQE